MARLRDTYGNSRKSGFALDFFHQVAGTSREDFLASPFYSTYEPIQLLTSHDCRVSLLIRLCDITHPHALRKALDDPNVTVRYYTAQSFHAKFYIVGDKALVGSANLTSAGLMTNREVSVVLDRERDAGFAELPPIFDQLWDFADVLNGAILQQFEKAYFAKGRPSGEDPFDSFLKNYVTACAPPTAVVGSDRVTRQRSFLQGFRRKYDEVLIPVYRILEGIYTATGIRRPEFVDGDLDIEINRLLGWLRVVPASGEGWREAPLRTGRDLETNIRHYIDLWFATDNVGRGDVYQPDLEVENIALLRRNFDSDASIEALDYDDLFDTLLKCHAFLEQLRFTKGGIPGLKIDFQQRNKLDDIKRTLKFLLHGSGDGIQRAYDCIHDEGYKLERFAEACVMELLGWVDKERPPFNGRTIKGLRFLGFDVSE
jgi:hypothetical protein